MNDIDEIGEEITTGEYIEFEDSPIFTEEEIERNSKKIKKQTEGFKKQGKKKVTLFSKIPESLIFDDKVPSAAKLLYAAYFKFSRQKDLDEYPWTFVKQSKLAAYLKIDRVTVSRLTILLERERWIEIIKRGQGFSQIVVLLPEKGKTLSNEERQQIKSIVDAVINQHFMDLKRNRQ